MACTAKAALNSEVHLLPLEVAFKADAPRCRYPENKYKKKEAIKKNIGGCWTWLSKWMLPVVGSLCK